MKRMSLYTQTALAGIIALSASASNAEQASPRQDNRPSVEAIEQHWLSVIREPDPVRRQVLVGEHRRLLEQVKQTNTSGAAQTPEKKVDGSRHRNITNTIEMHILMIDMME